MIRRMIALALAALILASCGGKKDFKVTIESPSVGTQRLTVVYTLADGNRAVVEPTAVDGKVEFRGASAEPSLVEVFGSTGAPLVRFMAQNGEKIHITFADGAPQINGAMNPLLPEPAQEADTARFVSPSVIVRRDSAETWPAEGIWVFTSSGQQRTQAVMDTIRANRKRVRDVYVGVEMDVWHEAVRRDSATWKQGLLPEGPLAVPALTTTPLLLEVDTAGQILRRHTL